jgi:hypothetical protein
MNKIKMLFWLLLSCLSLNASNVTVTNQLTYHDHIEANSWFTDAKTTLFVPEFNPAIGTPVKATVYMQLNITNRLYFENMQSADFRTDPEFTGQISVTNQASISFWGVEVLNLFATNVFDATGFDGVRDYTGTSGVTFPHVVTNTVVFDVDVADISGYSVWKIESETSARAQIYLETGAYVAGTYTIAGVDVWVVYTYTNTFNCPDCVPCKPKCDNDDDRDKDKDKECKDNHNKPKNPKDKDCDDDKDRDKKNGKNGRR